MTATYDIQIRAVECQHCGAPLEAQVHGGLVTCAYCGTSNQVSARPVDRRQRLTPAEDIARLTRLKAQVEHSVTGHAYDLRRPPAGLDALQAATSSAALEPHWVAAKARPSDVLDVQRGLCWLALRLAELHETEGEPLKGRATLETALDLLPDAGHRHLIRCALADSALQARDVADAEGWLGECDPAPEVLELDSAYRCALARTRLVAGQPQEALAIIGPEGHLPISAPQLTLAALIRCAAYEALNQPGKAREVFDAAAKDNGDLVGVAQREHLALVTAETHRTAAALDDLRNLRVKARAPGLLQPFMLASLLTPLVALALALVVGMAGTDTFGGPFFGLTSHVTCPRVCDGCRGPYATAMKYGTTFLWCQAPAGALDFDPLIQDFSDYRIVDQRRQALKPYRVPGAGSMAYALAYFCWAPIVFAVLFPLLVRGTRVRAEAARAAQADVRRLESELGDLARLAHTYPPPRTMDGFSIGVILTNLALWVGAVVRIVVALA